MSFGDKLLANIEAELKSVGLKFELLQWIDQQGSATEVDFDDLVQQVLTRATQIFQADSATVYALTQGNVAQFSKRYTPHPQAPSSDELSTLLLRFLNHGAEPTLEEKGPGAFQLIIPVRISEHLALTFVFESTRSTTGVALPIQEGDTMSFASMLADQLSNVAKLRLSIEAQDTKDRVVEAFFGSRRSANIEKISSLDGRWQALATAFLGFMPKWSALRIDPPPLLQILTTDPAKVSLSLRASQGDSASPARTLLASKTICGILVDAEEGRITKKKSYYIGKSLYVNPTKKEFRSRYASYMFSEMPHSELVVPIRFEGRLIGVVNLEHPNETAFTRYHVEVLEEGAKFMAPFVAALELEEDQQHQSEVKMLYLMHRVLHKIAHTYHHKVGQRIPAISLALEVLELSDNKFKDDELVFFEQLRRNVKSFADLSETFLRDLPNYISYGRQNLSQLVLAAISDFDPEELRQKDNIDLVLKPSDEVFEVFASTLAREHIYNVINNSIEAIREAQLRHREDGFRGKVVVSVARVPQSDKVGRPVSYDLASVHITDNGGGCDPSNVAKILEPRFTTKKSGTGFGLTSAFEYLETLGGRLQFKNDYPQGFAVQLQFPIYNRDLHRGLESKLNATKGGK